MQISVHRAVLAASGGVGRCGATDPALPGDKTLTSFPRGVRCSGCHRHSPRAPAHGRWSIASRADSDAAAVRWPRPRSIGTIGHVRGGGTSPRSVTRAVMRGGTGGDLRTLRARCATGRSMNSPLGSCAAAPPAWSKAASTCRAQATSSASGSNAAWIIGNWAGWMADLPKKPRARLAAASRRNPSRSLMCG